MTEDILAKRRRFNDLFSVYGALLTDKQREIVSSYYAYDLSLSEIAEGMGISRAAISDALNKAEEHLEHYEAELGFLNKKSDLVHRFERIKRLPEEERLKAYESLGEEIENGI